MARRSLLVSRPACQTDESRARFVRGWRIAIKLRAGPSVAVIRASAGPRYECGQLKSICWAKGYTPRGKKTNFLPQ